MLEKLKLFRRIRTVGFDLGTHSIKWAVVDPGRKEVTQTGLVQLFPDRTSRGQMPLPEVWEERLQESLAKIPGEVTELNTVIQGPATTYGYLEFPELSDDELRVAALAEAQRWIPYSAEQTQFSYTRVPPLGQSDRTGVFYAAALRPEVSRLRSVLARLGRNPQRVEIPALSLAREFEMNQTPKAGQFYALLQVGFTLTHLVVVKDGSPYYGRDFAPGLRDFAYALQMTSGCSWKEALEQVENGDFGHPAFRSPLERLVESLRKSFHAFGRKPAELFVSGGGGIGNLAGILGDRLGFPAQAETWKNLKCASTPAGIYKLAAGLGIS